MSVLLNLLYGLNVILIKLPASYMVNINRLILKFTWRGKRPRIGCIQLKKKKVGGSMLPKFKI